MNARIKLQKKTLNAIEIDSNNVVECFYSSSIYNLMTNARIPTCKGHSFMSRPIEPENYDFKKSWLE